MPIRLRGQASAGRDAVDLLLEPSPRSVPEARAAIRAALGSDLDVRALETVQLVVTELVTNSVIHADLRPGERIHLRVWRDGPVCVEVRDRGRGFDRGRRHPVERPHGGRGLSLVAALSVRWGYDDEDGVRVWSEIASD